MIRLGPFDVDDVVARGGMGEIWRGFHRAQGTPVAVKVMTGSDALSSHFLARFRDEVRAASGLDHPNVVLLFDHGTIPASASRASGGRLVAGSPYLAMEYASGGSLAQVRHASSWAQFRAMMRAILTAVAHAHAHGVLHRDIKPGNVLRCLRGDMRPGLKLADFGIARSVDLESDADPTMISGTLRYMAPEQARGDWRDEGPWTDVYSVGCVAFRLASGQTVPEPTVEAGRTRYPPMPTIAPRFATPPGFAAWLARMIAHEPEARFAHAADVSWALSQLDGDPGTDLAFDEELDGDGDHGSFDDEAPTRAQSVPPPSGLDESQPTHFEDGAPTITIPRTHPHESIRVSSSGVESDAPPIAASWREGVRPTASPRLLGTGMGLYGLRSVPVVDRDRERDRLWDALRDVAASGAAKLVLIEGASGCGKSRLAEWLCERAAETGAAHPVRAAHNAIPGSADGLAAMIARLLRVNDLKGGDLLQRVRVVLARQDAFSHDDALGLAQIAARDAETVAADGRALRLETATERFEVIRRHMVRMAYARPVILLIDDAQWASDALGFAQHVLERSARSGTPLLMLATVRTDALEGRSAEAARLARLTARADVVRLEIGALPPEHWPVLVRELLGLEGDLAQRVEQRTAGNPLFAVQLVGDWVQRGLLVPGPNGFRLRPGATIDLPDTIHQVWAERTAQLLEGRDERDGHALELAAVLGTDVRETDWRDACALAAIAIPPGLVDALLDRRLAQQGAVGGDTSWSFVHAMFRESLERRAAEHGRLAAHHAICARLLGARQGLGIAERLGRHALASGDLEGAIAPLLAGAREHMALDDAPVAVALLTDREEALRRLGAGDDDVRWAENWSQLALADGRRGQMNDALGWARKAETAARRNGWQSILANALFARGRVERWRGMNAEAELMCTEALEIAHAIGDLSCAASCEWLFGAVVCNRGDAAGGLAHTERAMALAQQAGDLTAVGRASTECAVALHRLGRFADARAALERAKQCYEQLGSRQGIASTMHQIAEILREEGQLDEAERLYREALSIFEAVASSNQLVARLNIGLTLLARRAFADARHMFEDALPGLEQTGFLSMLACSHIEVLACCADACAWDAWDAHYLAGSALLASQDLKDPDLAWAARLAGDCARDAGERQRAADVYSISASQYRGVGRMREADEIDAVIAALRGN